MTFRVEELIETEYGEKAVLDVDYDNRSWVQVLPWGDGEYGESGEPQLDRVPNYIAEAAEDWDWPDDYAAHQQYDQDLDAWTVDADDLTEVLEFWQAQAFNVEIDTEVELSDDHRSEE